MSTNTQAHHDERRGSIYLVVLVVVASVVTMVLVGTALRRTTAEHYRTTDDRMRARQGARSATEAALTLMDDKDTFLTNARGGTTIMKTAGVGKSTLSVTVVDKDTGTTADDDTETLLVTAAAETDEARSLVSFDVQILPGYLDTLLDKGATSYWALDEAKNESVAVDQIGAIDGTYSTPKNAGKEDFPDDGVAPGITKTTDVIDIPHDSSFETSQGTIVIWALFSDMSDSDTQTIFSKEDNDAVEFDVAMYVASSTLKLVIDSKYDFLDRIYNYDISSKNDKDWHHFAYSFGLGGTRIYVDGVRVSYDPLYTIGLSYSYLTYTERNDERWYLGARRDTGSAADPIDGSVARFAFFPTQLSDSEIAELMDAQINAVKLEPVEGSFARVVE